MTLDKVEYIEILKQCNATSTLLADALGKKETLPACTQLSGSNNQSLIGPIFPLFASNGSNYNIHKHISEVPSDSIVVIFTYNCSGLAVLGEIVCDYLFNIARAKALVVHGLIRDVDEIRQKNYPVWALGSHPVGCRNNNYGDFPSEAKSDIINKYSSSIAICDASGVSAVSYAQLVRPEIISSIHFMSLQERIWSYCVNELKWDTYKTIVKKDYLLRIHRSLFSPDILDLVDKLAAIVEQ